MFGLRARILWIAGLVMAATIVAITLTAGAAFSEAYSKSISERSEAISHELATQFERLLALGLRPEEIIGFEDQCAKVARNHHDLAFAAVVSPQGKYLFHSDATIMGRGVEGAELARALATEQPAQIAATLNGERVLATLMPVFNPARQHMADVLIAHDRESIDQRLHDLFLRVALVGLAFLVLGGALLYWAVSRFVTAPLHQVVSAVDTLRAQSPEEHKRIPVRAEAELGVLIDGFNRLLERLESHQRELEVAREQALDASRAKSEFLAMVSHELRTPLNGILGMNGLLLRSPLNDKQTRFASAVNQSGHKLLEIIEEILDFTSIEAGDLEIECAEFDPREVIADVAAKYEPAAGVKGLEFTGSAADSLPPAMLGDRRRLGQVLSLLLGNAIKFTDAGFVRLDALAPTTGEIEFRISDSGIGIAPDKREIIFEPFRQGDGTATRRHGGTGLGLTIAKRLVDGMGGRIDFESEVGRGTTFRVTLPLGGPASSPDA